MEAPGFEPGAFRMQSECDTTTPHSQSSMIDTVSIVRITLLAQKYQQLHFVMIKIKTQIQYQLDQYILEF